PGSARDRASHGAISPLRSLRRAPRSGKVASPASAARCHTTNRVRDYASSHPFLLEQRLDGVERFFERAAERLQCAFGPGAHALRGDLIPEKHRDLPRNIVGRTDLDGSAFAKQRGIGFAKVVSERSGQYAGAVTDSLNGVLSAVLDERSTNEGDGCNRIKRSEFADAVSDIN